jgi:hypothetical protein
VVDGVWSTTCVPRQDLFAAYRIVLNLEKAQELARTEYYYADAACEEALATLEYQGSYELMVTGRDFIYGIDIFLMEQSLAALNPKGQQRLEELAFCGQLTWPLAVAQNPQSFDPSHCTALGPMPLKNLNLVEVNRGFSLDFGSDLAHENERPWRVLNAPQLVFFSQSLN